MTFKKEISHKWPHTGAILAGGKSRRMGTPKQEILLPNGLSMIEQSIKLLSSICRQIVVVGKWDEQNKDILKKKNVQQILDHMPGLGPLCGIETLLKSSLDNEYLVIACDQPFLTEELLLKLTNKSSSHPKLFKFEGENETQPFPGYYPKSCLPIIESLTKNGKVAMYDFICNTQIEWINLPKNLSHLVRSINTPSDLQEVWQK